jgi:hypothetical protein
MQNKELDQSKILNDLRTKGYHTIDAFIKLDDVEEIENDVTKNRYSLNQNTLNGLYYETQYYFINLLSDSKKCYDFITSNFLLNICQNYLGDSFRLRALRYYETMSGHIMKWHTDNKQDRKKIKFNGLIFIIYISDVEDGEFQFIEGSHKFSDKFDSPELSDEFINSNYSNLIKSFKLPKGSLIIYDATGIHRAKPFTDNNYVRKSLYFQVDAYEENGEKILLNSRFLNNLTPEIKKILGLGKENNYPTYPNTNLNRMPINGPIFSMISKWLIYRLVRKVLRTEPRRIINLFKKLVS